MKAMQGKTDECRSNPNSRFLVLIALKAVGVFHVGLRLFFFSDESGRNLETGAKKDPKQTP